MIDYKQNLYWRLAYQYYYIKINCISPGFIKSDMTDKISDNFKQSLENKISLERFGEPEDVAYAILYLASDESKFMTGTEIVLDGGLSAM